MLEDFNERKLMGRLAEVKQRLLSYMIIRKNTSM